MAFSAAVSPRRSRRGVARGPRRQRRRLPAPAGAEHALPLLRQHHRRLRRPGGGDPGARRRHQPGADRAQPRLRRPAALLRARAPDGRGRRAHRARRRRGAAPQPRATRSRTAPRPAGSTTPATTRRRSTWLLAKGGYDELRARQESARAEGAYYGVGLALVVDPSGTNIGYVGLATPASERKPGRDKSGSTEIVRASVDLQGVVTVLLGSVPQGQGHATVARRVAARRLGLPVEQVRAIVDMDTATTPWTVTSGSYSSRFAPLVTSAVVAAVDRLAETVRAGASVLLGVDPAGLELADGSVRDPSSGASCLFRHAAGVVHWDPGSLPEGASRAAVRRRPRSPRPRPSRRPRRTRSTRRSATASSRRWSACASTPTPCSSPWTGSRRCTTRAPCSTRC